MSITETVIIVGLSILSIVWLFILPIIGLVWIVGWLT